MNEKLKNTWDYIVSECVGMRAKSINVGGHLRRAAVVAAAEELEMNEEFCRWLPMSGWYYGELTGAWHKDHDESNTRYKFEDVVKAWMVEREGRRQRNDHNGGGMVSCRLRAADISSYRELQAGGNA